MADFCTNCAKEMFGEEVEPDIDVKKIFDSLEPGFYTSVLCEGCGMAAISKMDDGELKVVYLSFENGKSVQSEWVPYTSKLKP